eukprot:CAMPEP_0174331902 /NCGR_PEP_ID=MMETSP0810-20121108/17862_1 /TAXON_ID=73025 ORGANISM="Eutreptiella gymnastica-like, Strain CCMP1594" /NCGR_SAMPLE_ID=MMETSP0810 /ASSEMBLY_ACC=CAM_ASM_000659 /LENGTH=57 /DNA_ID=CAMNT_0015447975 /DNA_START=64 /DNA_END=235 /DNA_ORIENTATION=-
MGCASSTPGPDLFSPAPQPVLYSVLLPPVDASVLSASLCHVCGGGLRGDFEFPEEGH